MVVHNSEFIAAHTNDEKTCISFEPVIAVKELARAYVPIQFMCDLYTDETNLTKGTIFPELYRCYKKRSEAESKDYHLDDIAY